MTGYAPWCPFTAVGVLAVTFRLVGA